MVKLRRNQKTETTEKADEFKQKLCDGCYRIIPINNENKKCYYCGYKQDWARGKVIKTDVDIDIYDRKYKWRTLEEFKKRSR